MTPTRQEIFEYLMPMLNSLSQDWDYAGIVGPETRLFTELGMESLDLVVLAAAIQSHFGQVLPFALLFAEMGEKQLDLTVSGLMDFLEEHLAGGRMSAAGERLS
ncbi:MAG: acyl carrier protein [Acidobacteriota bacterium]